MANKMLVFVLMALLTLSFVTAEKAYNPITKIATIKQSGTEVARFQLIYNTANCGGDVECYAIIKATISKATKDFVDNIKFRKLNDNSIVSIAYDLKEGNNQVAMEAYSKTKDKTGDVYIKLSAHKSPSEIIDWIPTLYGQEINDWAVWGVLYTYDDYITTMNSTLYFNTSTAQAQCSWLFSAGNYIGIHGTEGCSQLLARTRNITLIDNLKNMTFRIVGASSGTGGNCYFNIMGASGYNVFNGAGAINKDDTIRIIRNETFTNNVFNVVNATANLSIITNPTDNFVEMIMNTGSGIDCTINLYKIYYVIGNTSMKSTIYSPAQSPAYKFSSIAPVIFNITSNVTINGLQNVSLYISPSSLLNNTNISGASNNTIFQHYFNVGNYSYYFIVCDNDTNCKYTETRNLEVVPFIENSQSFNPATYETNYENFSINITYDSSEYAISSAYLIYNNTYHLATQSGAGNNLTFSVINLQVPAISSAINISFYWRIGFVNSSSTVFYNSNINSQAVSKGTSLIVGTTCSAGYSPALNFSFYYEPNRTIMNTTKVDYYVTYGLSGNDYSINSSLTGVTDFSICINNSQAYYTIGYGEIRYTGVDADERGYYIFSNTRITNITTVIPLYGLETSKSTSFLMTASTTGLIPYSGYYIGLLRWYPDINSYKVVEMGKTDERGQTVLRVKTEDVDYRLVLYTASGNVVKMFSPVKLICQTNPCVYTLYADATELDLTTFTSIQKNLSYDSNLKRFTFIWNDASQAEQTITLNVYKDTGTGSLNICNNSASGYVGVLICDVSSYTGNLRAEAIRQASPPVVLSQLLISLRDSIVNHGGGTIGLFIGALLLITMALIGIASPVLVVILGILSLIPLYFLGSINMAILAGIGIIGGVILHFLRRT
jgi:hypothetical protein